jgi:SAM-dependent methyltransferase
MTHDFDQAYWQQHWRQAQGPRPAPNPYLAQELSDLRPGTALDAGCGTGAEALWLASHGWQVTAADISAEALSRAAPGPVTWVEADLTTWHPGTQFDLVTTHYAHPAMPQPAFYNRIAEWVAPGGTLLIVDHAAGDITAGLDDTAWKIVTAAEHTRTIPGRAEPLHDVVMRAIRVPA